MCRVKCNKVLVVGDVMIDTYYLGIVNRVSPEAPVPVFKKTDERSVLGGAANVAANILAAEQNVYVMSIVGHDANGEKLKSELDKNNINTDFVFYTRRKTTEKTRFLASNNQQVLRLDVEDTEPISLEESKRMLECLSERIREFNVIVISDYLKGLLTYEFTQGIINLANKNNIPVIIDVKDQNYLKYSNAFLLKPNMKELADLTDCIVETDEEIIKASEILLNNCFCKYVLTTCGSRGMVLVGDGEPYIIPSIGHDVFDVTGAGDTTIAYLATCIINGMSIRESVDIANVAAGIQVSKVGTSSVSWREIRENMSEKINNSEYKVINGNAVDSFREEHDKQKIVFTNGCFDILHVGHIRYLREAAKLGDILVVGLNSDKSVKRLKGMERPINNQEERAEMIGALGFVDYIIIFEEDTPLELIKKIQPDILVKGGDYKPEEVVGKKEVEYRGGKLVLIPFVEGKSTTRIIDKLRDL